MIKTKIAFEDIRAGDLLEVVVKDFGVKSVLTGIAFKLERMDTGVSRESIWWATSEGGMIVNTDEDAAIYRIDVREVGFEDVRVGDFLEVTSQIGDHTERVLRGRAHEMHKADASWYDGWYTEDGTRICSRAESTVTGKSQKIVILERKEQA